VSVVENARVERRTQAGRCGRIRSACPKTASVWRVGPDSIAGAANRFSAHPRTPGATDRWRARPGSPNARGSRTGTTVEAHESRAAGCVSFGSRETERSRRGPAAGGARRRRGRGRGAGCATAGPPGRDAPARVRGQHPAPVSTVLATAPTPGSGERAIARRAEQPRRDESPRRMCGSAWRFEQRHTRRRNQQRNGEREAVRGECHDRTHARATALSRARRSAESAAIESASARWSQGPRNGDSDFTRPHNSDRSDRPARCASGERRYRSYVAARRAEPGTERSRLTPCRTVTSRWSRARASWQPGIGRFTNISITPTTECLKKRERKMW